MTISSKPRLFEREFDFRGKHAEIVVRLVNGIDTKNKGILFNSNIDVFIASAVIGLSYKRTSEPDKGHTSTKIFSDAFSSRRDDLRYLQKLCILLHNQDSITTEQRIEKTFRFETDEKLREEVENVFVSYVLGGVEVLGEVLLQNSKSYDDALKKFFEFLKDFNDQFVSPIDDDINLFKEIEI